MEKKWRCTVCGYIHAGEQPPDFCPVCGATANLFKILTDEVETARRVAGPQPVYRPNFGGEPRGLRQSAHLAAIGAEDALTGAEAIKQALFRISYGLFIITSSVKGRDNGQCANTCFQITSEPPQIALGINKNNYTHELIEQSGKLGVSILNQTGQDYAKRFGYRSGRDIDKFEGLAVHRGSSGVLLLNDVLATLEAKVVNQLDAGTHTLYLAEVTGAELLQQGEPMTYAYFRETK